MIKSSHFLHFVDVIDVNRRRNHVAVIARVDGRNMAEFAIFGEPLAPDRAPTVRLQGVDAFELLDAARAALRALHEAHEGNPIAMPLGVSEARDCLIEALSTRP